MDPRGSNPGGSGRQQGVSQFLITMLGLFGIATHRARQDLRRLLPAAAVTLLAAVLAASGPVYAEASRVAGVQQSVSTAPPDVAGITVSDASGQIPPGQVEQTINQAVAPAQATIRQGALSRTFTIAGQPDGVLTEFLAADGLAQDAELVAGQWPQDSVGSGDAVPVALPVAAADGLGLAIGDTVLLTSIRTDREVSIVVQGLFQLGPEGSVFEGVDGLLSAGVVEAGGFTTHGPLVVGLDTLRQHVEQDDVTLRWWATLQPDSVYPQDLTRVARSVDRLVDNDGELGLRVDTSLPDVLNRIARATAQGGGTVAVALLQLLIVALAALILVGGALADDRRGQAGLLRSRGAGVATVALLAAAEAAPLAVPAALLGPPLAMLLVRLIGALPPPLGPGLDFPFVLPGLSWLAALVAVVVCVVGLAVTAAWAARSLVMARAQRSGRPAAALLMAGGDLILVGLAVVGLWQLRGYRGGEGLDVALIAAPAIGLLAVLAVGLRLLTRLLSLLDGMSGRWRGLSALSIRSVARRRSAAMRSVALPLLAVSTGVLALTTNASWETALQDRAVFLVGADLRGDVTRGYPSQVDDFAGVTAATPVWSSPIATVDDVPPGRFVAIDADVAGQVVPLRSDLVEGSWPAAVARLAQNRPAVPVVVLPAGTTAVTADVRGQPNLFETVVPWLILRDNDGLFQRVAATIQQDGPTRGTMRAQVPPGQGWGVAAMELDVNVGVTRPETAVVIGPLKTADGTVLPDPTVDDPSLDDHASDETASDDPALDDPALDATEGWVWQPVALRDVIEPAEISDLPAGQREPGDLLAVRMRGAMTASVSQLVPLLRAVPGSITAIDAIPVLASPGLVERLGRQTDVPLRIRDLGSTLQADVVGMVTAFPPDAETEDVVVADLRTVAAVAFAADGRRVTAEQLLISTDAVSAELRGELTAAGLFRGPPLERRQLLEDSQSDPVATGLLGALTLTTIGAAVAGAVGFAVAARAGVRGRRVELAALRALGFTIRRLHRSLLVEQAMLFGFALVAGVLAGLLLATAFVPASLPPGVLPPLLTIPAGLIGLLLLALLGVTAVAAVTMGGLGQGLTDALRLGEDVE